MAKSRLVGLVFEAWRDMDRALAGLNPDEAAASLDGGSSFAWTLAHVTNQVDAWINVRFLGRGPHTLIGQERFRIGGSGAADEWLAVQAGVREVRDAARGYLAGVDGGQDLVLPYDGSLLHLRETGLSLDYALARIAAHYYFHIGEVASKRSALGHDVGDYPDLLEACLPAASATPRRLSAGSTALRPLDAGDRDWLDGFIQQRWGAPTVVAHGVTHRPAELAGFVALGDGVPIGLVTYHIDGESCEIVTIDSLREGNGIGTALLDAVKGAALEAGCRRLWLITTNDNLRALRFYQRRGFALVAVHRDAITRARDLKPQIPLAGNDGIPMRDEIEVDLMLIP